MKDKYLTTPYGSLCYWIENGNTKTILFLHGGGGSSSAWNMIRPYLDTTTDKKIYVDLRGHGKSFRPENWRAYRLEEHANDTLILMNRLHIKKCTIIGHCLGSMVAATIAAYHPERVERLILINPGVNRKTPFFNHFTQFAYNILNACVEFLKIKPIPPPKNRVDYSKFRNSHDFSLSRLWMDLKFIGLRSAVSQTMAFFDWNYEKIYRKINVPTCIIGGVHDSIFNRSVTEKIKNFIIGAKLSFVDSNHISVVTGSKEVAEKIQSFLGQHL